VHFPFSWTISFGARRWGCEKIVNHSLDTRHNDSVGWGDIFLKAVWKTTTRELGVSGGRGVKKGALASVRKKNWGP